MFESNLAGQRTAMVDPNAGATSYVYDANGQSTSVTSPAGTITMGYDVLGRLVSRTTGGSSSATWDYVDPGESGAATDLGLLRASTSTTHTSLGDLKTVTSAVYDSLHRPVSSTTTLPTSPAGAPDLLGDLSGTSYTTTAGYDALGQPTTAGLPAMGGLSAETVTTGYRKSGSAEKLTLTSPGKVTSLVTGVTYSGTGQMLSRTYGNGVTRSYGWDPVTRALTGLSASFVTNESGSAQTAFVQKDSFTRDVMGRITTSTNEVPVSDGTAAAGQVTAECFTYDGFNRLSGAWTVADATTPTCGTAAPANATSTGWDASTTAYAAQWSYSTGGRITSLVKGATGAPTTSTYSYADAAHPAAVTQVADGTTTDSFGYDTAGRMVSRTVNGVTTALTWDVTSSLVESNGQGGHVVYAYDASGQRVVQARVADANGVGTATGYVASGQVDDPNTATTSTGDVSATRYYTFAGSTVAVRTDDGKLSLMLGDEQGSTNVMMPVTVQASGALASATLADAAASTRTSYTPYGELRGADNAATDRGWLGQVEDRVVGTGATSTGTGLTYLNARYYDPATSRFISPDPLLDPGDPKTLDPYRYADNNPVVFTDATGLRPIGQYDCAGAGCNITNHGTVQATPAKPKHTVQDSLNTIARLKKEQAAAPSQLQVWLTPTKSTYVAGAQGGVNFLGGFLNGTTSMVNGLTSLATGGHAAQIPSVGIWGNYDDQKYSSWLGSANATIDSFFIPGGNVGKVGSFLSKGGDTASAFSKLKFAANGIDSYANLRFLSRGEGGEVQIHHLIEQRFSDVMRKTLGANTNEWASIAVTRAEHHVFTNAWRAEIPYGASGTRIANSEQVFAAARALYRDYPEILSHLGLG